MLKTIEEILLNYNLEYSINENLITVNRNGKTHNIKLPISNVDLEIELNLFCVYSPETTSQLKEKFPFYFEKPIFGETICVKEIGKIPDIYSMKSFKEFKNNKIICLDDNQEKEYDFYSKFDGINHPFSNFWHNGKQEHITWEELENIMYENLTIK